MANFAERGALSLRPLLQKCVLTFSRMILIEETCLCSYFQANDKIHSLLALGILSRRTLHVSSNNIYSVSEDILLYFGRVCVCCFCWGLSKSKFANVPKSHGKIGKVTPHNPITSKPMRNGQCYHDNHCRYHKTRPLFEKCDIFPIIILQEHDTTIVQKEQYY